MPKALSSIFPTAPSNGSQKLGQPVPLSNFVGGGKEIASAAGATESSGPLLVEQRAGEWPLGGALAQDGELIGGEQLAPFIVGVRDREQLAGAREHGRHQGERASRSTGEQE